MKHTSFFTRNTITIDRNGGRTMVKQGYTGHIDMSIGTADYLIRRAVVGCSSGVMQEYDDGCNVYVPENKFSKLAVEKGVKIGHMIFVDEKEIK